MKISSYIFRYSIYFSFISLLLVGCGSSSDGGSTDSPKTTQSTNNADNSQLSQISLPLGIVMNDIKVVAGQNSKFVRKFDVPEFTKTFSENYNALTIDVTETVKNLTLSDIVTTNVPIGHSEVSNDHVKVVVHISSATDPNPCSSSEVYGPFMVSIDRLSQPQSAEPGTVTASQSSLNIINAGSFQMCLSIISPVSATVDMGSVELEYSKCEEEIAQIGGIYSSTYSCEDSCDTELTGTNTFEIFQEGHKITHLDGEGSESSGTICGDTYKFSGKGAELLSSWKQTGQMKRLSSGIINGTVDYEYMSGRCKGVKGHCNDVLTKLSDN